MKPTSKSIRQKELFRNFDQLLKTTESLNQKRKSTYPSPRPSTLSTSRILNTISLLETDIYTLSLEKNEIKTRTLKVQSKLTKLQKEFIELKEKFIKSSNTLLMIKKSIDKMKKLEKRRK